MSTKPKAYAYSRISSRAQLKGDGLRRQLAAALEWSANHPDVDFDPTFRDEGVSAFRGDHRDTGKLGVLLGMIEAGTIRPNDYILIDEFSRLTREAETEALYLLTSITRRNVRVVTLVDGEEYHAKSEAIDLMRALFTMSNAHRENKERQRKVAVAWSEKKKRARETGEVLSKRGPAWTIYNPTTKRFDLDHDKAEVIRGIFAECLDGLGITAIAQRLNANKVEPFVKGSDGWHQGYVLTILRSPSVMGFYQPTLTSQRAHQRMLRQPDGDPIPNYYPAFIDEETFDKAQAMIAMRNKRGGGAGRKGKTFPNLIMGMGKCEECGGTLVVGNHPNSKRVRAFRCYQANRKQNCDNRQTYLCADVEERLTAFLMVARMEEAQPLPDQTDLTNKLAARHSIQMKIDNLNDTIENREPGEDVSSTRARLSLRQAEASKIDKEIEELRATLKHQTRMVGVDAIEEAAKWLDSLGDDETDDLYRKRAKANAMLLALYDTIMPIDGGLYVLSNGKGWLINDEVYVELDVSDKRPVTRKELEMTSTWAKVTMI
ncbi:recombinase family protein [Brevundimonas sp.]|uniref:recombinase family protein n=1 Tax=Brevundimonas sp. TaxID=1871086 RepID=UPI00289B55C9|nr:recombinase family protein [Brevundimonas sp.]